MKTMTIFIRGLTVLALTAPGLISAGESPPFDFRRARWGMSPEEVRASEESAVMMGEIEGVLSFEGEIAGAQAGILYIFQAGGLARGVYTIEDASGDTVMTDYAGVRFFLLDLHGEDAEEKMNLTEDESAGVLDPFIAEDLQELVLAKAAAPETVWSLERTDIYLRLTEKDGRAAIQVDYIAKPQPSN